MVHNTPWILFTGLLQQVSTFNHKKLPNFEGTIIFHLYFIHSLPTERHRRTNIIHRETNPIFSLPFMDKEQIVWVDEKIKMK